MAEDEDLEVLGAAVPVRSTTTDEQTDEGADGKVEERPHRPIVPGLSERESGFPTLAGFVPTQTMPDGLRWFAENQPFTPIIETLRGLLLGTPIGDRGLIAVAWCVAISLFGFLWARRLYEREPAHR
jgi:hypothetical protein